MPSACDTRRPEVGWLREKAALRRLAEGAPPPDHATACALALRWLDLPAAYKPNAAFRGAASQARCRMGFVQWLARGDARAFLAAFRAACPAEADAFADQARTIAEEESAWYDGLADGVAAPGHGIAQGIRDCAAELSAASSA
ncbi:MAG: hypothetical protein ABFC67_10560 [Mizugakiibacter sp.]|uniref:hypothetical protein n=1 Tax=Mizugakiibacter sp. TaxID=1972610 RepID=UPI0031C18EF8|nr:hypothetical protein [Xanthomonadaceae bacterium]